MIYTSYFYQVRHMPSNYIPLSTALWDPKWYHNFGSQDKVFIDKRGVINGLRIPELVPGKRCEDLCRGIDSCTSGDPSTCEFLKKYREQLEEIDLDKFLDKLKKLEENYSDEGDSHIVLLFHETPNNPCSERVEVTNWLISHGINVKEFDRREVC